MGNALNDVMQYNTLSPPGNAVEAGAVPGEAPDEDRGQDAGEEPEEEPHSAVRCKLCLRDGVFEDASGFGQYWVNGFCPQCLANPHRERISFG